MASITVRSIDDDLLQRVRRLATAERRSLNSQLLLLIKRALEVELTDRTGRGQAVARRTQIELWRTIAGTWDDDRETKHIICDIYAARTLGRDVEL